MHICFTHPIRHGRDQIHTAPAPLRLRPPRPPGLNLGTYDICYGCGFVVHQGIQTVQLRNYELMILTDTTIPDEAYCHNHLGYTVVCYQVVGTVAGGEQEGVGLVVRKHP